MSDLPPTVIGVPGTWADRTAIMESIAKQSEGYLFAGQVMMHMETEQHFGLEVYEHDPRMREAFELVSGGNITEEELEQIANHTFTLYLIGVGEKTSDYVHAMMCAATGLLKAGGLGVKVESTGVSYSRSRWVELMQRDPLLAVLFGCVAYISDDAGVTCSCGMHSVGLPDALVEGEPEEAVSLLKSFVGYQFLEQPTLRDGETFQAADDGPVYRIDKVPCTLYEEDDLFFNANGMWRLTRE